MTEKIFIFVSSYDYATLKSKFTVTDPRRLYDPYPTFLDIEKDIFDETDIRVRIGPLNTKYKTSSEYIAKQQYPDERINGYLLFFETEIDKLHFQLKYL